MSVMECPHCEDDVDTVTRTGENRYSCGECNMVIAKDDLAPHLDELEVIDKRDQANNGNSSNDSSSDSQTNQGQSQEQSQQGAPEHNLNDREKIYQMGLEGLKEIKKQRLKNWLSHTEGVGSQTQNRVLMVFDRNETIHKNPHILYNLLDDELSASSSYINTMVEDIFAPERENEDLLNNQGYTPWYRRNSMGGQQQQMAQGGGQPLNAAQGGQQGFAQSGGQSQQGGMGGRGQQQQGQQQQQGRRKDEQGGDDGMSHEEAVQLIQQGLAQERQQQGSSPLREGLSDATDEALKEMATNIGGLAGTVQKVIDEALVQYARDNPEWVIENMGMLQKVIGASNGPPAESQEQNQQAESDAAVDDALSSLASGGGESSGNQHQSSPDTHGGGTSGGLDDFSIDEEAESDFTPSEETQDVMGGSEQEESQEPDNVEQDGTAERPNAVKSNMSAGPEDVMEEDQSTEQEDDEFEEIFGDVAE